jgi:hypothetical protein
MMNYLRIFVVWLSMMCASAPALANFAMSPSGGTTLFAVDAANQGTSLCAAASTECAASVPINTAGTPLFTASLPAQVSLANTGANGTALKVDGSAVTQPVSVTAGTAVIGSLSAPNNDRQATATCTTVAVCVTLSAQGGSAVGVEVSANTNVTIIPECEVNSVWAATNCPGGGVWTDGANPTISASITTTGSWTFCTNGHSNVRLRVSAIGATPTATMALEAGSTDCSGILAALIASPVPTGTNTIGNVGLAAQTTGGCTPGHFLSAASNNLTQVKASAGTLCYIEVTQTTTTLGDLRLYDLASAACNSGTGVVLNSAVQSNATSPGFMLNFGPYGKAFANGIGICLTGAVADNDNTNFVTGAQVNYAYK